MGFTPSQVDRMSLWEFSACCDGIIESHGKSKAEPPSYEEYDEAMRRHGVLH